MSHHSLNLRTFAIAQVRHPEARRLKDLSSEILRSQKSLPQDDKEWGRTQDDKEWGRTQDDKEWGRTQDDRRGTERLRTFIAGVFFLSACAMPLLAAEDAKNPAAVPPSAQITMTQQSIRDQVKAMRQQRYDQMPYLSRSFIRSEIKPQKVKAKSKFLASDDEKNLQAVIGRAIAVYIPVRAAKERISLAQRKLLIAIRGLFPDAKFEFNDKTGAIPSTVFTPLDFNSRQYRFSFRQPVFRGGILWNTLLKEKATLESERRDYQAIVEDLVKEVSEGYLEYNRTLAVYRDQEKVLLKMKKYAEISKQKYDNQLISEIEHLNVQSLFGQIRYEHETAKQEKELAKLELERYLDLSNADPLTVAPLYNVESLLENERGKDASILTESAVADIREPAGLKGEVEAPDLATLTDLAYQHRAKLRVEASELDATRLDEKIKWGELMPQVDVVMEFGALGEAYDANIWHPKLNKGSLVGVEFNWNLGGNKIEYKHTAEERPPAITVYNQQGAYSKIDSNTLSVGLFDGLSDLAATKEAEIAKLNQVNELDKAEKEVLHDVKKAYFDYQKAKIQVKSALQRVDYQERLARISEHKLGKNEVQIGEYIESENKLLSERIEFHKALADYFKAKVQLNHAVGMRDYLPLEEWYGSESPKFGAGPVKAQTKKSN